MSVINIKDADYCLDYHRVDTNISAYLKQEAGRFRADYLKKVDYNVCLADFEILSAVGAGTFGRVMLSKEKSTGKYFALKLLDKEKIVNMGQVERTLNEKRVLQTIRHPFVINSEYFFQDNCYLYFVMPFIAGGEIFGLLNKMNSLNEHMSKFYSAQVCMGLEYLHALKLIYRDLKPENILIDLSGYIKIADLGFCKLVTGGRTYTLCGTPEYIAPEILLTKGYNQAVDWWSFGIFIFELTAGFPPFRHKDPLVLYERIVSGYFKNPDHFSICLRDLLKHILQVDLTKRYGNLSNGVNDIKCHKWYKEVNWTALFERTGPAPFTPSITSVTNQRFFRKCDNEPIRVEEINRFENEFAEF